MFMPLIAKAKLNRVIRNWVAYRDVVLNWLGSREVSPEQEEHFLALKARIAKQLPWLTSVIPPSVGPEAQRNLAMMTDLLNRFRSLKIETVSGQRVREEFDRDWHESFIFLNKLTGVRLAERPAMPQMRRFKGAPSGMPHHRMHRRRSAGLSFIGMLFRLVIFVFILFLFLRGFGVTWASGKAHLNFPATTAEFWSNVKAAVGPLWAHLLTFFQPAIDVYGPLATLVLLALGLFAIFYFVFVRG